MANQTSKQMIAWRDRILRTPKHLREFEEECALRSIEQKIRMAEADERRAAAKCEAIERQTAAFHAIIACANSLRLLPAVSDLYLHLSDKAAQR